MISNSSSPNITKIKFTTDPSFISSCSPSDYKFSSSLSSGKFSSSISPSAKSLLSALPLSDSGLNELTINWSNISYVINKNIWCFNKGIPTRVTRVKQILQNQSGSVSAGNLVAILGPSGSGKSSLLECITGRRRKGVKGEIFITNSGKRINHRIAFIPQKDHLLEVFTVRETLLYASRLKNYSSILANNHYNYNYENSMDYHNLLVDTIIKQVHLENCSEVKVSKCSGGQVKRLSFAIELISKPDIIVLDEPTSGLDSTSILQCIQLFKRLTCIEESKKENDQKPILMKRIIILTIHQPSFTLLNLFHKLYILSYNGKCIYFGTPANLVDHFSQIALKCPPFHNPADFAIEISNGIYGKAVLNDLEKICQKENKLNENNNNNNDNKLLIYNLIDNPTTRQYPLLYHVKLLLLRTWTNTYRKPQLLWLRVLLHILVALTLSCVYSQEIGQENGCFSDLSHNYANNNDNNGLYAANFERNYLKKFQLTLNNSGLIFFCISFAICASITTTVLTFPLEILVFFKERSNGWYNCGTYYISKLLADFPFQIIMIFTFAAIVYPLTNQILEFWRFSAFLIFLIQCSLIAQSIGMLFGAIFINNFLSAVFMAPASTVPVLLFSGFFVRLSQMPASLKPLAYFSYVRYTFEGTIAAIYGYNRCLSLSSSLSPLSTLSPLSSINDIIQRFQLNTDNPDIKSLSLILGINESCAYSVLEGTKPYINYTRILHYFNNTSVINYKEKSFIMTYFDVDDQILLSSLIILTLFVIVLRILAYFVLLYKSSIKN